MKQQPPISRRFRFPQVERLPHGICDSGGGAFPWKQRVNIAGGGRSHYENFLGGELVSSRGACGSIFFNLYAYCRISDDLGDEVGDTAASLQLLDEWEGELNACYDGQPRHPVFVALG